MGGGVWGRMDTCICMAESLHCPPEKKSKGIPNFVFQRGTSRKISTWTYLQNRNRLTDMEDTLVVAKREG